MFFALLSFTHQHIQIVSFFLPLLPWLLYIWILLLCILYDGEGYGRGQTHKILVQDNRLSLCVDSLDLFIFFKHTFFLVGKKKNYFQIDDVDINNNNTIHSPTNTSTLQWPGKIFFLKGKKIGNSSLWRMWLIQY